MDGLRQACHSLLHLGDPFLLLVVVPLDRLHAGLQAIQQLCGRPPSPRPASARRSACFTTPEVWAYFSVGMVMPNAVLSARPCPPWRRASE